MRIVPLDVVADKNAQQRLMQSTTSKNLWRLSFRPNESNLDQTSEVLSTDPLKVISNIFGYLNRQVKFKLLSR